MGLNTQKRWLNGAAYAENVLYVKSSVQVRFSVTGQCSKKCVHILDVDAIFHRMV